jgi:hypothetical protein
MNRNENFLIGFVLLAVWFRLIPHPPNVAPITALALFSGASFRNKWFSIIFPLIAMLLSDIVLGFSTISLWVYSAFILITMFAWLVKELRWTSVLISSLIFFIISNFGVWVLSYPHTIEGLITCYTMAIPFFGYSILGDMAWSLILFGLYETIKQNVFVK